MGNWGPVTVVHNIDNSLAHHASGPYSAGTSYITYEGDPDDYLWLAISAAGQTADEARSRAEAWISEHQ